MKINQYDDCIIIYLSKDYYDFEMDDIEENLYHIFEKIKKYYLKDISGYYETTIYIDKLYGIIIDMKKEELDFIDYNDQIDMRTTIKKVDFLYRIDDNFYFNLLKEKNILMYLYQDNIYIKLKNKLHYKKMLNLIEHSQIRYKNTEFVNYGKIINI